MKKSLQLLITILCVGNLNAQTFTEHPIYDEDKITNQSSTSKLFDFDGDGDQDLLVSGGTNESRLLVFINDGNDLDSLHILYDYQPQEIDNFTIADFDNDGDDDIIIQRSNTNFHLHENLGNGNFSAPTIALNTSYTPTWFDGGDVDGDGLIDMIFTRSNPHQTYWKKNMGGGVFSVSNTDTLIAAALTDNAQINTFRTTDFEGDGDLDIFIVTEPASGYHLTWVCLNDGSGNYSTMQTPTAENLKQSFVLEDFNGDGFVDFGLAEILQSGPIRGEAKIFWNDQANNFSTSSTIATSSIGAYASISAFYSLDFNQDGSQDVVVGRQYGNSAGGGDIYLNDGSGNFTDIQKSFSNSIFLQGSNSV